METTKETQRHDIVRKKTVHLELSPEQYQKLERIFTENYAYIHDERFSQYNFMESIMNFEPDMNNGLSFDTRHMELLFMQYNYCRFQLAQLRDLLLCKRQWHINNLVELLNWYDRQNKIRSTIITGNMGLVLSMSKHVHYSGVEFTDLISEGSMALLRSVDRFDYTRGFRFSTYACRAILKGFSRIARRSWRYRNLFPAQLEPSLERDNHLEQNREVEHKDQIEEMKYIITHNLAALSETEQSVVEMRFSLQAEETSGMTLKQVGEKLGLSKERVRQIQNKALKKLRHTVEEHICPV